MTSEERTSEACLLLTPCSFISAISRAPDWTHVSFCVGHMIFYCFRTNFWLKVPLVIQEVPIMVPNDFREVPFFNGFNMHFSKAVILGCSDFLVSMCCEDSASPLVKSFYCTLRNTASIPAVCKTIIFLRYFECLKFTSRYNRYPNNWWLFQHFNLITFPLTAAPFLFYVVLKLRKENLHFSLWDFLPGNLPIPCELSPTVPVNYDFFCKLFEHWAAKWRNLIHITMLGIWDSAGSVLGVAKNIKCKIFQLEMVKILVNETSELLSRRHRAPVNH